jgi:hypothetical protein
VVLTNKYSKEDMDDELLDDGEEKPVEIDDEDLGDPALIDPTLDAEDDELAKVVDDDEDEEDEEDGD